MKSKSFRAARLAFLGLTSAAVNMPMTAAGAAPAGPEVACEPINFDPLVMADGMAPTNDPILLFRSPAYAVSFVKRRTGQ